eukprot:7467152-Pyramimonas_sp.AAC.1
MGTKFFEYGVPKWCGVTNCMRLKKLLAGRAFRPARLPRNANAFLAFAFFAWLALDTSLSSSPMPRGVGRGLIAPHRDFIQSRRLILAWAGKTHM